jgi:DNA invertase Pin-like site-specific DNA recombinase
MARGVVQDLTANSDLTLCDGGGKWRENLRVNWPMSVSSPGVGGEEPVVGQEPWEEMHRLRAAGMTVSGIARATGLDRKTVRRCLRQALAGVPAPGAEF